MIVAGGAKRRCLVGNSGTLLGRNGMLSKREKYYPSEVPGNAAAITAYSRLNGVTDAALEMALEFLYKVQVLRLKSSK